MTIQYISGEKMKIIRRINHNAALAVDGNGQELVVLGKGIGFPQTPYELTDMSKVAKTFYNADSRYINMLASIPQQMLLASADIVEQAEINLNCSLNPNIVFTLADHLNFAMERMKKGIDFNFPLAYDVAHLYPNEYEIGELALDIVEDYAACRLPAPEAINVALHIINAEEEVGDIHSVLISLKMMTDINTLIEDTLGIEIDKDSFEFSRFKMHLIYLIKRLSSGKQLKNSLDWMLKGLTEQYPEIYYCACQISEYFRNENLCECSQDELLYLMVHINRLKEKMNQ